MSFSVWNWLCAWLCYCTARLYGIAFGVRGSEDLHCSDTDPLQLWHQSTRQGCCLCCMIASFTIKTHPACPVLARERCRIGPPCFLAECRKRGLNQGSLFCCVQRCLLFWVVFSFCIVCIINLSSICSVFSRVCWCAVKNLLLIYSPPHTAGRMF